MSDTSIQPVLRQMIRMIKGLEETQVEIKRELAYMREILGLRGSLPEAIEDTNLLVDALSVGPTGDFNGLNWFPSEESPTGPFRWSGPGLLSVLFLPLRRSVPLVCRLRLGDFAIAVPQDLIVYLDGQLLVELKGVKDSAEFILPPAAVPSLTTELSFLTSTVTQPAQHIPGNQDMRWLGFRFQGLEIYRRPEPSVAEETAAPALAGPVG